MAKEHGSVSLHGRGDIWDTRLWNAETGQYAIGNSTGETKKTRAYDRAKEMNRQGLFPRRSEDELLADFLPRYWKDEAQEISVTYRKNSITYAEVAAECPDLVDVWLSAVEPWMLNRYKDYLGKLGGSSRRRELRFHAARVPLTWAFTRGYILRSMDALRAFELPFNLTNGGPVNSTETLSLYAYREIFEYTSFNFGAEVVIMLGTLSVSKFPPIALLSAMFLILLKLGLLNDHPALIIAHTGLFTPMAVWILSNYSKTIPLEIEDSGRIDGCSGLRLFWDIILTLSVLISAGLIVFIFSWNEFPLSLVLMTANSMRTVPVGISLYPGEYGIRWATISTATFLAIISILAITGIFKCRIIGGLTEGSNR